MFSRGRSAVLKYSSIRRSISSDTIFGLSSGHGKCGVAVIRVSGSETKNIIEWKTRSAQLPEPRRATLKKIYHATSADMIDRGLLLWFPGPNSFTGEDSVEFHVHGGAAIVSAMYDSLSACRNSRLAEPGEFTKRAFFAGKLDLTEVEGLADLIEAETEAQRRQALLQANGELSKLYNGLRERLVKCIASAEAYIDFAEDQDVEDGVLDEVQVDVNRLIRELTNHLSDNRRGERLRTGVRTTIIGAPNVGKSSLINLISQRNVSIVTNIAGTTRDIIESHYDIGGYPVILADTAGLRTNTDDVVEHEGISRAKEYVQQSDFVILMADASSLPTCSNLDTFLVQYVRSLGLDESILTSTQQRCLTVFNKSDLLTEEMRQKLRDCSDVQLISCTEADGLSELLQRMTTDLRHLCGNPSAEDPTISQQRHRHHLKQCLEHLETYSGYMSHGIDQDLAIATQHLRNAVRSIGRITGAVGTEDILDVIFSTFCIGK